jgi:hypothetical protein
VKKVNRREFVTAAAMAGRALFFLPLQVPHLKSMACGPVLPALLHWRGARWLRCNRVFSRCRTSGFRRDHSVRRPKPTGNI